MSLTLERLSLIFDSKKWTYQNLEGLHNFVSEHGIVEISANFEVINFKKEDGIRPIAFLSDSKTKRYRLWNSSEVRWDELSRKLMQISADPGLIS